MDSEAIDPQLLERLWERAAARMAESRRPESTYRLQFHAGFTFRDAEKNAAYLGNLGITHSYASPYLRARPGSTHGYDIINHGTLNPEIGSWDDYEAWVKALHETGLGQIIDIVPNHMGVATNDNAWWNDVLENGPASRFGTHFDITWNASSRPELQDKVLLPVLGEPYGDVLEAGQLKLCFEAGAFAVTYFDRRFPVGARSYARVLAHGLEEFVAALGAEAPLAMEYQSILSEARNLPDRTDTEPEKVAERAREKEVIKRRLAALAGEHPAARELIEKNLEHINGTPGDAESFTLLDDLLEHQCYRLAYWRVAPDEINYRRFFDINDLAALSMERTEVYEAAHELVFRLVAGKKVDGLRIDHPDGLYDPAQYFLRLQESFALACGRTALAEVEGTEGIEWADVEGSFRRRLMADQGLNDPRLSPPLYVVAEKILGAQEPLVESWAVHGTSGYDFVNAVNGLFVDSKNLEHFTRLYQEFVRDDTSLSDLIYQKKLLILNVSLASELHMLTHQLDRLAQKSRKSRDFTFNTLRRALREVAACFPVYRSYVGDGGVSEADRRSIEAAIGAATARNPLLSRRIFQFIRGMLLLEFPSTATDVDRAEQRRFAGKFQQVTAPVTAKGIEDTAFYVYNRLVSLNEVGGDPDRFGVSPEAFHAFNADRQARWPYALSPLSTHDTKRSEDVRARLNVLSEIPEEWRDAVGRWHRLNEVQRNRVRDQAVPDANEEYLLYQSLVGAWPLEPTVEGEFGAFIGRIQNFMEKSLHEAKVHSSWINPNEEYDAGVRDFVGRILDEGTNKPFVDDIRAFAQKVSDLGLYNSQAQTLLKIASPGVPDTYQGTEIWDFSLVDPDNRRAVDYERRAAMLRDLQAAAAATGELRNLARGLVQCKEDGRVKLYVTYTALQCRRDHPGLFTAGEYVPLESTGAKAGHVLAFTRRSGEHQAIVAVPRLIHGLVGWQGQAPLGEPVWDDTRLILKNVDPGCRYRNVFTGEALTYENAAAGSSVRVANLFRDFPVALLISERTGGGQ